MYRVIRTTFPKYVFFVVSPILIHVTMNAGRINLNGRLSSHIFSALASWKCVDKKQTRSFIQSIFLYSDYFIQSISGEIPVSSNPSVLKRASADTHNHLDFISMFLLMDN